MTDCEAVASVGSKGNSYTIALAEALNSSHKAELARNRLHPGEHGPWEGIGDAKLATTEPVHWFNNIILTAPSACVLQSSTSTPAPSDVNTSTEDIGEQTLSQPQPTTTSARQTRLHKVGHRTVTHVPKNQTHRIAVTADKSRISITPVDDHNMSDIQRSARIRAVPPINTNRM